MARCDSYDPGQCTWGACELEPWCPEDLGNGGDWAADARSLGFTVTMIPTVGSICCYAAGDGYSLFGHVGVVEQVYADGTFLIREMNYVAAYEYDNRVSSMADVAGFILPPGVSPGAGGSGGSGGSGLAADPGASGMSSTWSAIQDYYNSTVGQQAASVANIAAELDAIK